MSAARFSLVHQARLVWALGWADFLLKYRGSVLGYLWSFLVPLCKFLVFLFVFQPFIGSSIELYPLYLFLGIIIWEHFSLTTSACMNMIHEKAGIIQKVRFPRILLMYAVGWTHVIIFLTYFAVFLLFALFMGADMGWSMLYLPLLLVQMTLLALGIGMFLCSYALRYQDIRHLWDIALQLLFWLTPITYAHLAKAPLLSEAMNFFQSAPAFSLWGFFRAFTLFQPLSTLVHDARRVTLYPEQGFPTFVHGAGMTLVCIVVFLIGYLIFRRRSRYFLEEY